jgi:hypothetical protein
MSLQLAQCFVPYLFMMMSCAFFITFAIGYLNTLIHLGEKDSAQGSLLEVGKIIPYYLIRNCAGTDLSPL